MKKTLALFAAIAIASVVQAQIVNILMKDGSVVKYDAEAVENITFTKADPVEPIQTETLFMVGDATPAGWNIEAPTPLTASAADPLVFEWEGQLADGELKLCTTAGSWDVPFIRPIIGGTEIGKKDIVGAKFAMHAGDPDNKWRVAEAGKYKLTFNLRNWTMSTKYLGAPVFTPIEAENVYIVGDATPAGWNIDAPTQMTKKSQYVFVYEGQLYEGEFKACTQTGDWGVSFIRPTQDGVKISRSGVENNAIKYAAGDPDYKWVVTEAGNYRLTFDLENYTITVEAL